MRKWEQDNGMDTKLRESPIATSDQRETRINELLNETLPMRCHELYLYFVIANR